MERKLENMNKTEPATRSLLMNTLENRDKMLDNFKKIWYEDIYLVSEKPAKISMKKKPFFNINTNDVVLIKNIKKPRPSCQLGRVIEIFRGDNNKIHFCSY